MATTECAQPLQSIMRRQGYFDAREPVLKKVKCVKWYFFCKIDRRPTPHGYVNGNE